ncbi:unnamed protein product [Malus baccata var. baccata]
MRQMWYLLWKHKMLKLSTREQCLVGTRPKEKTGGIIGGKEAEYFEKLCDLLHLISLSSFLRISGLSDRRFDLNFGDEAAVHSQDNIWRSSFLSPTGHLTVGDFVMKNDMIAAVVAMNLLILKDNRLLSKRFDELVQCSIRGLKHENKQLHMLAHDYATNMKRKLDQLQESDAPNDQSSVFPPSGVLPSTEAPNNHPPVPHISEALQTAKTSSKQPL